METSSFTVTVCTEDHDADLMDSFGKHLAYRLASTAYRIQDVRRIIDHGEDRPVNEEDRDSRDGIPLARLEIRGADFYFANANGEGTVFFVDYNLGSQMIEFRLDDSGVLHFGITRDGEWKETLATPKENLLYWKVRDAWNA